MLIKFDEFDINNVLDVYRIEWLIKTSENINIKNNVEFEKSFSQSLKKSL